MDNNAIINVQLLAQMTDCLAAHKQFNPMETEEQKQLYQATEYVLASVSRILTQMMGKQSFAGNQVGDHRIDPMKSSFV